MTNLERVNESFQYVNFTRDALHSALRSMCPAALKAYDSATTKLMRAEWSPDRPTRFCCYFVAEMTYWYCFPHCIVYAMTLDIPGDTTLHRFVEVYDEQHNSHIVDLTCDQFDTPLDYSRRKPRMFLQTGGVGPSKRAQQLASLLKLERIR